MLTLENKPKIKSNHYSHKTPRLKKPKRNKQNPSLKLCGEESNKWKTQLKLSHNCYTIDGTCMSEGLVSSEKKISSKLKSPKWRLSAYHLMFHCPYLLLYSPASLLPTLQSIYPHDISPVCL